MRSYHKSFPRRTHLRIAYHYMCKSDLGGEHVRAARDVMRLEMEHIAGTHTACQTQPRISRIVLVHAHLTAAYREWPNWDWNGDEYMPVAYILLRDEIEYVRRRNDEIRAAARREA